MEEGTVSRYWLKSTVTPVHKCGDRDNCGSYSPVDLTSMVLETCERFQHDRIVNRLEANNPLIRDK